MFSIHECNLTKGSSGKRIRTWRHNLYARGTQAHRHSRIEAMVGDASEVRPMASLRSRTSTPTDIVSSDQEAELDSEDEPYPAHRGASPTTPEVWYSWAPYQPPGNNASGYGSPLQAYHGYHNPIMHYGCHDSLSFMTSAVSKHCCYDLIWLSRWALRLFVFLTIPVRISLSLLPPRLLLLLPYGLNWGSWDVHKSLQASLAHDSALRLQGTLEENHKLDWLTTK